MRLAVVRFCSRIWTIFSAAWPSPKTPEPFDISPWRSGFTNNSWASRRIS